MYDVLKKLEYRMARGGNKTWFCVYEGQLALNTSIPLEGLEFTDFQTRVEIFLDAVSSWSAKLATANSPADDESSSDDEFGTPNMIKI